MIVCVCFVGVALASTVAASFPMFVKPMLDEFGWSRADTYLAMTVHLLLSGLFAPIGGALIDRFGPRAVMPVGAILAGIALVWLSRTTELWHLYVSFGVMAGAGSQLIHYTPVTTVVSKWFVTRRGTAMGVVGAGTGISQAALMPAIAILIGSHGWRTTYLILAGAILVLPTTLIWLFLYARPEDRGLSADAEMQSIRPRREAGGVRRRQEVVILDAEWAETSWTLGKAIRRLRFWALALMMSGFAAGFFIITLPLVQYLTDSGYPESLGGWVLGIQNLVGVIGTLIGGVLADRIGREKTLTLSAVLFLIGLGCLYAGGLTVSLPLILAFAVTFGIGYNGALPSLSAAAADLFAGEHFGAIFGSVILIGFSAGGLGAWLSGHLFDVTQSYMSNFALAATVLVGAIAMIWVVSPGRVRTMRTVVE